MNLTHNTEWGEVLTARLKSMGRGSASALASAVDRHVSAVTRWKRGEVPPIELWAEIGEFMGDPDWVPRVLEVLDELDREPLLMADAVIAERDLDEFPDTHPDYLAHWDKEDAQNLINAQRAAQDRASLTHRLLTEWRAGAWL